MSVYATTNIFTESTSVEIDLDTVQESAYEPGIMGAMQHVLESEQNWASIMEAVAFDELGYFAENGKEMIYEASSIGGFIAKVKAFFKKIIEKIAGLFKKFIAMIDSFTKTDSEFVKKYRNQLLKVTTKDFEFKGYEFTIGAVNISSCESTMDNIITKNIPNNLSTVLNNVATAKDTVQKVRENRDDILENMRGACVGETSVEAGEFQKELHQKLRKGEESPVTIDKVSVSDLLSTISNSKDAKKVAEKAYKDLKKSIEDSIKELDKKEKEYTKIVPDKDEAVSAQASTAVAYISTYSGLLRDKANILQIVNGAILSAIKAENRQAKAVCVKLLTYAPKNESYVGEATTGSFLDSVQLV